MAKHRYVDTRFWHDTFIKENLNPLDRYLFLYFLTNDKTNVSGIYECPISIIANETGIEKEMIVKMLKRLKGKIYYIDGWIFIRNFQKYQNLNNIKIRLGIESELRELPANIKEKIEKLDKSSISHTRVIQESSHLTKLNLTQPNSTKLNTPPTPTGVETGFDEFWKTYPKKVNKVTSLKSWNKIKPEKELQTKILEAIEKQKRSEQWKRENGRYVPDPATWLNNKRWEDESEIQTTQQKNVSWEEIQRLKKKQLEDQEKLKQLKK